MSANTTTAMHGQSSHVGLLGAAAVLTAVVAAGAIGIVIGTGVRPMTVDAPVAGPVIDSTSMSGPRTGAQKGLGAAVNPRVQFASDNYVVASGIGAAYGGSDFAAQYEAWAKAQAAAASSDFPDLYQRLAAAKGPAYGGSDFAAQYEAWAKAQAAASSTSFPDYFQRHAAPAPAIDFSRFRGINLTDPTVAPTDVVNGNDFARYYAFLIARAAAAQGQVDNEADLAARLMAAQAPATSPIIHRDTDRFLRHR